jgi:nitrate/nitrite-specific signal transduction histidine kinase
MSQIDPKEEFVNNFIRSLERLVRFLNNMREVIRNAIELVSMFIAFCLSLIISVMLLVADSVIFLIKEAINRIEEPRIIEGTYQELDLEE